VSFFEHRIVQNPFKTFHPKEKSFGFIAEEKQKNRTGLKKAISEIPHKFCTKNMNKSTKISQ
jgi:hypothetical protein